MNELLFIFVDFPIYGLEIETALLRHFKFLGYNGYLIIKHYFVFFPRVFKVALVHWHKSLPKEQGNEICAWMSV